MAEYIERENLIDYLTRATGHKATCDGCCDIDCVDCIRDEVIKNLPTADVVEVRHGKWKVHKNNEYWHYDCPFCDDGYATKGQDKKPPNYCGNCGARMDGVTND